MQRIKVLGFICGALSLWGCAEGAEADQKCDGNRREANNSFHQFLLDRIKSSLLKLKVKRISVIPTQGLNRLWSAS